MNILKRKITTEDMYFMTNLLLKSHNVNAVKRIWQPKKAAPLNEDFILGYYYQKNAFYQKKDKNNELEENKVVSN